MPCFEPRAQLLDARVADRLVQAADLGARRRVGGGRGQAREARVLDEERHAALDQRLEAGPEVAVRTGSPMNSRLCRGASSVSSQRYRSSLSLKYW